MAVGQLLNSSFKKVIKFLDIFKNTFLINSSDHNENQVQKYDTKCKMHQSIPSIKQSASCNNFTFKKSNRVASNSWVTRNKQQKRTR